MTAVNCGTRISSTAELVGLKDPADFTLTVNLPNSVGECGDWIKMNTATKINNLETALRNGCGTSIPCFANSRWSCVDGDPTKATFEYVNRF